MMNKIYRISLYILVVTLLSAFASCEADRRVESFDTSKSFFDEGETFFDNIPLKILLHSDLGYNVTYNDNSVYIKIRLSNLQKQISEECEKKFGFPVEFFSIKRQAGQFDHNDYRVFLDSGEIADLIFPGKINPFGGTDSFHFWIEEFIEKGYYKDLTPYLRTYCPDVYYNMQKYDFIMDMVTKNDKVYALYAGAPDVSALVLQVKTELLSGYNTSSIRSFDELYTFMEAMDQDGGLNEDNRIHVKPYTLLEYAVFEAGYYPLTTVLKSFSGLQVVFKADDPDCKPYFIEDTEILNLFFEKFEPFFKRSYFTSESGTGIDTEDHRLNYMQKKLNANIRLTAEVFSNTYYNLLYSLEGKADSIRQDTLFLFDNDQVFVDTINGILLIPVPYTSTQPEKALVFVNWLFTDELMAEYLTYGTDKGTFPNYQFDVNGRLSFFPDSFPMYSFCNLIANFSDKYIDNKTFDLTEEYVKFTEKAVQPPLYRYLESRHSLEKLDLYYSILKEAGFQDRGEYLREAISRMLTDPESGFTADEIKADLKSLTDYYKMKSYLEDKLQPIIE